MLFLSKVAVMSGKKCIVGSIEYELIRIIEEGGMGTVYEALQGGIDNFSKRVAIKVIRDEYAAIPEFRNNFVGEARLVSDLIHSNIVQTYHLGESDGKYYMVMEYVEGITLEDFIIQHLKTNQDVPAELAVFIVSRIGRGLAYAHQKRNLQGDLLNIVHRDVNPKNIQLSKEGDVKLLDFGIAKALKLMYNKEGEVIAGKDEYLSPEQANREVTDNRADIFPCGIILSELILGYNIFEGKTPEETRKNICKMPIPNFCKLSENINKELNAILQKTLMRDRRKRYQSANLMFTDMELYLYRDGYGPTHEKLAHYLKELLTHQGSQASKHWNAQEKLPPKTKKIAKAS